jgi:hypothetical protein
MVEKQPRDINQQPKPETVAPLTVTLSETAQRGVLRGLMQSLRTDTELETRRSFEDRPEVIIQLDETRRVTMQIANNLGEKIDPMTSLYLGLTDLLPEGQLEQWANMDIKDQWDIPVKTKAQFFLSKNPPETKP